MSTITGRLIQVLEQQSGQGANKAWKKQQFVIETNGQYSKKVCLMCWNDKCDWLKQLRVGDELNVSFNPESREYNGKWYTTLGVFKLEKTGNSGKIETTPDVPQVYPVDEPPSDDLPF